MFLGAFPVENTVGVVLESEFLIRNNWLLSSNPKLPRVVQLAMRYPKVAVQFPNPVRFSTGADSQLKNASVLPSWMSNPGSSACPSPSRSLMNELSMLKSSFIMSSAKMSKFKDKERGTRDGIRTDFFFSPDSCSTSALFSGD
jgi:hypothetical protein